MANSLGYELVKAEAEKSVRSKNPDAIDLDMRGRALLLTRYRQGVNLKEVIYAARALFEQALAIDPNNADAFYEVRSSSGDAVKSARSGYGIISDKFSRTVKSVARTNPYPVPLEGLRKAGLPEE